MQGHLPGTPRAGEQAARLIGPMEGYLSTATHSQTDVVPDGITLLRLPTGDCLTHQPLCAGWVRSSPLNIMNPGYAVPDAGRDAGPRLQLYLKDAAVAGLRLGAMVLLGV